MKILALVSKKSIAVLICLASISPDAMAKLTDADTLFLSYGRASNGYVTSPDFFNNLPAQIIPTDSEGRLNTNFKITGGTIISDSINATGHILEDGILSQDALQLLTDCKSKKATTISIEVDYQNLNTGETGKATMQFYSSVPGMIQFGDIEIGDETSLEKVTAVNQVFVRYEQKPELVKFTILNGSIKIDGNPGIGKILKNGVLDESAHILLAESSGKQVTVIVDYADPSGMTRKTSFVFFVQ